MAVPMWIKAVCLIVFVELVWTLPSPVLQWAQHPSPVKGGEQQEYFSTPLLQQYQSHLTYNQTTGQFETPFLVEFTSTRELFQEDGAAGVRALDDLLVTSTNIWGVYWMDAAIDMLSFHRLLPQNFSWRVTSTHTSKALDTLQSGLPVLRPWVPPSLSPDHKQHWRSGLQRWLGLESIRQPSKARLLNCAAAVNNTNIHCGDSVTCSVFGTSDTPLEQPTGTFQVFSGAETAGYDARDRPAEQQQCPVLGSGLLLGPAIRKLPDLMEYLGMTELAPFAEWGVGVALQLTYFRAALCPLLERMYLLANCHPIYYMLMSIIVYWQVYRNFIKMCVKDVRVAGRKVDRYFDEVAQGIQNPESLVTAVLKTALWTVYFVYTQLMSVIECASHAAAHILFWKLARSDCGFVLRTLRAMACVFAIGAITVFNKKRANVLILAFVVADCMPFVSLTIAVALVGLAGLVVVMSASKTVNDALMMDIGMLVMVVYFGLLSAVESIYYLIPVQDSPVFLLAWGVAQCMSLASLVARTLLPLLPGSASHFVAWCSTLSPMPVHDIANGILVIVYTARSLTEFKKIGQKVLFGQAAQEPSDGSSTPEPASGDLPLSSTKQDKPSENPPDKSPGKAGHVVEDHQSWRIKAARRPSKTASVCGQAEPHDARKLLQAAFANSWCVCRAEPS